MFIRKQSYLQAVSGGHEEEDSKNSTEHVTVVLSKVHCPTRSLGVAGGGHHPCQDADSGPLMGRAILQGIGSSFVSLACTKTVVNVVTLAVSLAPLLRGLSQVQRFCPLEIYQPSKTAPEKCSYRDGQSWIEFFFANFYMSTKVFITTKCLTFQHLFKKILNLDPLIVFI